MHHRRGPRRLVLALLLIAPVAACGGGPPPPLQGAPARHGRHVLAYDRAPDLNPASYRGVDTATFVIDAGPLGEMVVITGFEALASLEFRGREPSRVELRLPEFSGVFENPEQGVVRAGAADIGGAFLLDVDARGRVQVVDTPRLSDAFHEVAGVENVVRPWFVRLPGGPVPVGAAWTDTVRAVDRRGDIATTSTTVLTSTLEGDTVRAGRRLWVIRTAATNELLSRGSSGGVEVRQELRGRTLGRVLWDPQRHLLVHREERGRLDGWLLLSGVAAEPIAMRALVRRRVWLAD